MNRFAALDLSEIAPPDIIETLSFELILDEIIADYKARFPEYNVETLESDPIIKAFEVCAARELQIRARVNDAARAVMLGSSQKGDLEQLAALYKTKRLIVGTDAETNEPIYEDDEAFKRRVSLAPEAFSCAGPRGAYIYFALTGDGETRYATDADAMKETGGHVVVAIMGPLGEPTEFEINKVAEALSGEERLPMTDYRTVRGAERHEFDVNGVLTIAAGPDATMMKDKCIAGVQKYADSQNKLNGEITKSAVINAGFVDGAISFVLEGFEDIPAKFGVFPSINNLDIQVVIR